MKQHEGHFDDCGCLSARYEARLDAQRAATASLEALNRKHAEMYAKEIDRHEARIAALKHDEATLLEDNDYLRQRIAELEAELAAQVQHSNASLVEMAAHANALRDALERFKWAAAPEQHAGTSAYPYEEIVALLAATPAASLAAHDAEVLERAATECVVAVHAPDDMRHDPIRLETFDDAVGACADAIRALAAQEVKP